MGSGPTNDHETAAAETGPEPTAVERVLGIVAGEPLLWPVAATCFLMFTTFGAWILVFALRARSLLAGCILLVLIFLTVYGFDADIRARALSARNRVVLAVWAGSLLEALALDAIEAFRLA